MKLKIKLKKTIWILFSVCIFVSCTSETRLLNRIPIHSVNVEVQDTEGNPVQGAEIAASNGRATSTDENGLAKVRFGAVGVYNISVISDNHMPSNFVITMPVDNGKTFTRQLALVPNFSRLRFGLMNIYPFIYNYMFSSFGYSVNMEPYNESEFTVWRMSGDNDDILTMKKAFLKENEKGQQWWRMEIIQDDEESKYVAEILFSKDKDKILRYREQIDAEEIQEKPVTDDWYSKPIDLTEESIEGAVVEKAASVETPAGTFTADLLKFGPAPGTTLKIWKTEDVPGGVVKYQSLSDEEVITSSILIDFGSGAETMLNSY
ncbi:MAG TPA: Ig-like domain-containing protein [Balneolaceae bacterium]|nr:Ig-like domain-containing protein [Balneolaceae bacterium]